VELTLRSVCRQQFAHGRGLAESAVKAPETLTLPEVRRVVARTREASQTFSALPRRAALSRVGRRSVLALARAARFASATGPVTVRLYRWAIATHFLAGVREGLKEFGCAGLEGDTPPREARRKEPC
jgi:hypothetical protein